MILAIFVWLVNILYLPVLAPFGTTSYFPHSLQRRGTAEPTLTWVT